MYLRSLAITFASLFFLLLQPVNSPAAAKLSASAVSAAVLIG